MKFVKRLTAALTIVAISITMAGCDASADDPHELIEKNLKLSDGRTVTCVQTNRGNNLSCDWDHTAE